jgi:hypothetical protein
VSSFDVNFETSRQLAHLVASLRARTAASYSMSPDTARGSIVEDRQDPFAFLRPGSRNSWRRVGGCIVEETFA